MSAWELLAEIRARQGRRLYVARHLWVVPSSVSAGPDGRR